MKLSQTTAVRRFALILVLMLSLGFTSFSSAQSQELMHRASGLKLPAKLGELILKDSTDYETQAPGLGLAYRYQGTGSIEGVELTVYIYNLRLKEVPSDLKDSKFTQIRQMTRQDIVQAARNRDLSARSVVGRTLTFKTDTQERSALFDGFVVEARLGQVEGGADQGNAAARNRGYEFAALWSAKQHFIKLMLSRSAQSKAGPEQIQSIVQQWVTALE